jgi:solute:Na+ symporter, SSS family
LRLSSLDIALSISYLVLVILVAYWAARRKKKLRTAQDYFLAGRSLTWWVIGASVIASNISAEQLIGMAGSGFAMGLAIATYEWIAAPMLIIIAKWFMPIYLKMNIFTMPEFLEKRYDKRVRNILAVFWLLLYVFVNLTSVLYLGGLSIQSLLGINLIYAIAGLALFSLAYSLYGGLISVAWTDVINITFLIGGGLLTTFIALDLVGGNNGIIAGFQALVVQVPEKFEMIFSPESPHYQSMPGIRVIFGGLWVLGLSYWGCNQYIIQRAIAAKSLKEAQKGLIFAGYLKMVMPLIVVVPGIIVSVMHPQLPRADEAYPWLMNNLLPSGIKGVTFAALIAAIVSSLSSMMNSVSTIFTMDIFNEYFNKSGRKNLVLVGRITAIVAISIAAFVAPLLTTLDQVFLFIQEFSGFVSPAIFALFFFGLFWSRTTTNSVIWASLLSIPASAAFYFFLPQVPFLDRILLVFFIISAIIIVLSLLEKKPEVESSFNAGVNFKTGKYFNIASIVLVCLLIGLYLLLG